MLHTLTPTGPHLVSSHEGFDGLVARHPTAHHMVSNGFRYSFQSRGERQQLSFIRILDQARLSPRFAKDDVLRLQVVQNVPAKRSRLLYGYMLYSDSYEVYRGIATRRRRNGTHTHLARAESVNHHKYKRTEDNMTF